MTALAAGSSEALLREIADRMAVRRLVDLYARYADRRDAKGQAALFAEDAPTRATPRTVSPSSFSRAVPS
ncbi:nuclear transport factor 2 family protein [Acrocarpospora sp. B8E8]|uniref:nuclear transport factor 2 family protein n=1 Tax=Acrocarpospora sp. B8E8 TaxID=3153572 RepID=UPI00325E605D